MFIIYIFITEYKKYACPFHFARGIAYLKIVCKEAVDGEKRIKLFHE